MAAQIVLHHCGIRLAGRGIRPTGALQFDEGLRRRDREDRGMVHGQSPDLALWRSDLQGHGMEDVATVGGERIAASGREAAEDGIASGLEYGGAR
ncbi:hypothetical protein D3C81_2135770 [compost metagenome]